MVWRRLLPLAALSLLAGCGGADTASAPGAVVQVDVLSEPAGRLDPERPDWNAASAMIAGATASGLVTTDAAGDVVPALARSWRVSDDGFAYIFRLGDAEWSDGRKVTGADFVRMFRQAVAPGSRHPLADRLSAIENAADVASGRRPLAALGVASPMPDIVEIRLSSPRPGLLRLLTLPELGLPARDGGRIALGAFRVERTEGPLTILVAQPKGPAGASGVKLLAETNVADAIERFSRGETSIVAGGTTNDYLAVRAVRLDRYLQLDPVVGVYGYRVDRMEGAITDPRLRRALAMAIDRPRLIAGLGASGLSPLFSLVPPGVEDLATPAVPDWVGLDPARRIEEARALVAAVKGDAPDPIRIRMSLPIGAGHRQIFNLVAADWTAIGVESELVEVGDDADLRLFETVAPTDLATWFLRPFACARHSYCNETAERALSDARVSLAPIGRTQALATADRALVDDTAFIGLMTPVRWSLVASSIEGWTPNQWAAHPLATIRVGKRR